MSVRFDPDRGKFVVRWRAGGKRRCRRFESESEAIAFDQALTSRTPSANPHTDSTTRALEARIARLEARRSDKTRGGVYAYATAAGMLKPVVAAETGTGCWKIVTRSRWAYPASALSERAHESIPGPTGWWALVGYTTVPLGGALSRGAAQAARWKATPERNRTSTRSAPPCSTAT